MCFLPQTIDRWGRRKILLATFPFLCLFLLVVAFAFYIPKESTAHIAVIALGVYVSSHRRQAPLLSGIANAAPSRFSRFSMFATSVRFRNERKTDLCLHQSVGEGPVPFTYSAEWYCHSRLICVSSYSTPDCIASFPLRQRQLGMAWATAVLWFGSAVLSLTFPYLLKRFTPVRIHPFLPLLIVLGADAFFPRPRRLGPLGTTPLGVSSFSGSS